jgi:hypothetical protein
MQAQRASLLTAKAGKSIKLLFVQAMQGQIVRIIIILPVEIRSPGDNKAVALAK